VKWLSYLFNAACDAVRRASSRWRSIIAVTLLTLASCQVLPCFVGPLPSGDTRIFFPYPKGLQLYQVSILPSFRQVLFHEDDVMKE
jgi:hypothetical protein